MQTQINGITIALAQGDIADLDTDAIVNAANSQLCSAPAWRARSVARAARRFRKSVSRSALRGRRRGDYRRGRPRGSDSRGWPAYGEGGERAAGERRPRSLDLAEKHICKASRFGDPTGVFGFPLEACATVMLRVIMTTRLRKKQPYGSCVPVRSPRHEVFEQNYARSRAICRRRSTGARHGAGAFCGTLRAICSA